MEFFKSCGDVDKYKLTASTYCHLSWKVTKLFIIMLRFIVQGDNFYQKNFFKNKIQNTDSLAFNFLQ